MTVQQLKNDELEIYLSPLRKNLANVNRTVNAFDGHVFSSFELSFLLNFVRDVDSRGCLELSDMHDADAFIYSTVVGKYRGRVPTLDESYLQTPVH